jgi:hypothetical protein
LVERCFCKADAKSSNLLLSTMLASDVSRQYRYR